MQASEAGAPAVASASAVCRPGQPVGVRLGLSELGSCHFSMKAGMCNKLDKVKFFIKHRTDVPVLDFIINAGDLYHSQK